MSLKLATWITETLKSESEILEFIRENKYDLDVCIAGISKLNEIATLEHLMEELYYRSQSLFTLALNRIMELKPDFSEEFVITRSLEPFIELNSREN